MLRSIGFTPEDLHKPIIGIANTWTEIGPCNFHLRTIAEAVKQGVRDAGGTPMEFNTVTISDGITMGTEGMKASLISREVIADSIELVSRGNLFDGLICIAGCDKNMPGTVMSLARLNIPGLMLYGGSIAPGHLNNKAITIQDVYEAIGAHSAGNHCCCVVPHGDLWPASLVSYASHPRRRSHSLSGHQPRGPRLCGHHRRLFTAR